MHPLLWVGAWLVVSGLLAPLVGAWLRDGGRMW